MILYQTERYDLQKFSYEIPLNDDGEFVLWLKFAEVWFNSPNMKVFQVVLNDEHVLIDELDIFAKVGRSSAHDEYFPFQIKNGRLVVKGRSSSYSGLLKVTFQRIDHRDNPKVNAIIVWKGSIDRESLSLSSFPDLPLSSLSLVAEMPRLPALEPVETIDDDPTYAENEANEENEELDEYLPEPKEETRRTLKTSGPKVVDPYAEDHSSSFVPLLVALVALVPILFCLCRL